MGASREIQVMYECDRCNQLHDREYQAEQCCEPDVRTVYVCPVCDNACSTRESATACLASHVEVPECDTEHCPNCLREAETSQLRIEIAVAGHCSTCNPIYTTEQNLTIKYALEGGAQ
ncbi:hypothetical protein K32_49250 [Kaistia sp. 32K]|nr:hypothetical protein K32_49250 [Kaistia sp. 32K]